MFFLLALLASASAADVPAEPPAPTKGSAKAPMNSPAAARVGISGGWWMGGGGSVQVDGEVERWVVPILGFGARGYSGGYTGIFGGGQTLTGLEPYGAIATRGNVRFLTHLGAGVADSTGLACPSGPNMLGGTGDPSHWVGTASVSMGAMSARGAVVGLVRLQADTDGLVAVALGFEVGLPQTLPASPIGEQAASSR